METVPETEDIVHSFCIGQHESNRKMPVTLQAIQYAHASNVGQLTFHADSRAGY